MQNILVGVIMLAGIVSGGIAIVCIGVAILSARSEYSQQKKGIIVDLMPFLLLTPFIYNRIGKSYYVRAILFGIISAALVLLANLVSDSSFS